MMLGYQASDSENAYDLGFFFFFSIRTSDPLLGNAFDGKGKKKGGRALFFVCEKQLSSKFWKERNKSSML